MLESSKLSISSQVRSWCIREAPGSVSLIMKLHISPELRLGFMIGSSNGEEQKYAHNAYSGIDIKQRIRLMIFIGEADLR